MKKSNVRIAPKKLKLAKATVRLLTAQDLTNTLGGTDVGTQALTTECTNYCTGGC